MEDNPVKLLSKRTVVITRIIQDPVNTNIDFGVYRLTLFREVKGNDVGKEVVLKKLPIDSQQVFIGAEDVVQGAELLSLLFDLLPNKFP